MKHDYNKYWYEDIREYDTLKEMLEECTRQFADNAAYWVKRKRGGQYEPVSYRLLMHDVCALGSALLDMGLKGERIAVMGQGSYEWIVSYLAVINGVGVVVPIDKELSGAEIGNLMKTAGSRTMICTDPDCIKLKGLEMIEELVIMEFYGDRLDEAEAPVSRIEDLEFYRKLLLDGGSDDNSDSGVEGGGRDDGGSGGRNDTAAERKLRVSLWRGLQKRGDEILREGNDDFQRIEIDPDTMSVILFTSGTTGNPKGVMLSHRNIMTNIMDVCRIAYILPSDKTLSILPIHHTYECTLGMLLVLYRGASTAFCEGMKYISKNMKEAQNTVIIVVPRVLELIINRLNKMLRDTGKEKLFRRALGLSRGLRRFGIDVRRKLFSQVLESMGGNLRLIVTGAAALSPGVCRMFEDFGITVLQGYGMTECTPLISGTPMNADRERYKKAGSVGVPISTGEIRIIDQDPDGIGEVMFRGPNVMLGYYNMPEETAKTIEKDGWMHTGDLGFIDPDGWLYLAGRKKNIIVTKTGENVYPEEIEDYLNDSPYIEESMVYPHRKKEEEIVGVQILPAMDNIREKLGHEPDEEELNRMMKETIRSLNEGLAVYKRIRHVIVRKEDFVRTTTRKIRRQDNMPE